MQSDHVGFTSHLATDNNLTEADIAIAVAWFLSETTVAQVTKFDDVVGFVVNAHSVRK